MDNVGKAALGLDMQVLDGEAGLSLAFDYTSSYYKAESLEKFQHLFKHAGQPEVKVGELRLQRLFGGKK